ncbi:MAG: putative porin [Gammaproteobacteria bacterium]|nr:putative porin [Gammaproteobacteria bacterium]
MKSNYLALFSLLAMTLIATPAAAEDAGSWSDRIKLKADVRLRHESIDEDGEEDRRRARFRTRFGLSAAATSDVKFVLQLATGGDNPVSTNQSFDGGFSRKDIGVDLAYIDWKAADGLNIYGGKMKNPLYRAGGAPLIWDGDLNPEGLAATYNSGALFVNGAVFSVEERSSSDDSLLYAMQVGGKFDVADYAKLTAGVGYFGYSNTIGNAPFYNGSAKGNSVDLAGNYLNEYKNTELFAQFDTRVADLPLSIYAQWVRNSEVSEEDTAYAIGAKLGSAKEKGQKEFGWTYQDIEAEAVIGTFNDSDFGGSGTDASGHILKAKYLVSKTISLGGTLFINEVDRFLGDEHDYNRLQLDVEFKFQ